MSDHDNRGAHAHHFVSIVERHGLYQEAFAEALADELPDIEFSVVDDCGDARACCLVLLSVEGGPGREPTALRRRLETLGARTDGAPVVLVFDHDVPETATLEPFRVVGAIGPDDGLEIAAAAIRLALAGGSYWPRRGVALPGAIRVEAHSAPAFLPTGVPAASLTCRELEVLRELRVGRQNKNIAHELGISESTVKVHVRSILRKLRATNRTQAAMTLGG
ncbi:MAG: response regulator transcription factor [Hyphomicrobiales bacterium]|nr:response regulator transcription factor [Hyphomicrobiales bacterium]MDE2018254.1 response regulator transcription factor [Hyphomicrobiales bacterium]